MKHKRSIAAVIVFIIISLFCAWLYIYTSNLNDDKDSKLGILPGMTEKEIQEKLDIEVSKGMLNVSMNTNPIFKTGKSKGNLNIENISQNHYAYKVRIELDETGKTIYQSDRIRPGYYIDKAKLDVELKKGDYKATAYFDAYPVKENKKIGTVVVKLIITIKE